jgi:hypothetical protein
MVKIELYKTHELRVHDVLEYKFEDLMQEFVSEEEAGAEGEKQRTLIWAQGVVMWIAYIERPTSQIVDDEVNGILHFQRVTYAIKEKFEKRLVRGNVTINLLDQDEIPLYRDLAKELKERSQWLKDDRKEWVRIQNKRKKIEEEVGEFSDDKVELEFVKAADAIDLSAQQIADHLKERRNNGPVAEPEPVTESEIKKPSIRNTGSGTDEKLRS